MTCEEFATAGLDLGDAGADSSLQMAAREHLRNCPDCAALHENWLALREDLRGLGIETAEAQAPSRVEMRLRQEFRTRHKTVKTRRAALLVGWSVAAAAALMFAILWVNWRMHRGENFAKSPANVVHTPTTQTDSGQSPNVGLAVASGDTNLLVASNNSGDFTLLPDSMPPAPEDATVVHVRMQRAALSALGYPVNEEHAGDWIQVDFLVGDDGLPQAVRLPQNSSTEASN